MDDKQFDDAFTTAGGWFILTQFEEIYDFSGENDDLIDYMFTQGFDSKKRGTRARVSAVLRLIKSRRSKEALEKIRDSKMINGKHPDAEKLASEIIARRFK